jgi:signal transduction histidine kinase
MDVNTRSRFTELVLAIIVVVIALVWAERMAWMQISELRKQIHVDQIHHFRSADELRAGILERHALWHRVLETPSGTNWAAFAASGTKLDAVIRETMARASSEREKTVIEELIDERKRYETAVSESLRNIENNSQPAIAEQKVEAELSKLLAGSEKLTALNQEEAELFLASANEGLNRLHRFLFAALLGLLISGATLILLAYRRMIAPLSSNLVESRAIIERQEKLASLGVFATGIAHEIRNPLTASKVRLFSLKQSLSPGTSEREDLQVIGAEIDRLELIVQEFLQFARPGEINLKPLPVRKLLEDIYELLVRDLERKSVRFEVEIESKAVVRIDPNRMKQVLINLVQNAAESISGTGTVQLKAHEARVVLFGEWKEAVVIDVIDDGDGIPPEVQKRLFDPFFTTKEEGTGLGLPISARIVEKHGGVIQYKSQPNRGTTFSIVLPKALNDEREIENTPGGG